MRHTNFGYPRFSAALGIRENSFESFSISDRRRIGFRVALVIIYEAMETLPRSTPVARENLFIRLLSNSRVLTSSLFSLSLFTRFLSSKGMRNYGRYREYGTRKGERERDTFVDHLYDPWFRRSWKRRVQADLTELYLVQPLRDMTDRCISVLISVLSSWPLVVRTSGCLFLFFFSPDLSLSSILAPFFLRRRVDSTFVVCREGGGDASRTKER